MSFLSSFGSSVVRSFESASKRSLLVGASVLAGLTQVNAATITAASVSSAAVSAAISQASDGDTVLIPEGTATYTSTIVIAKAITLQGAGVGKTIILDNVTGKTTSVFVWNTTFGKSYRMTDLEIGRSRTSSYVSGAVQLTGTSRSVRIDHCKFNGPANEHITVYGGVYGVVDNCEFVLVGNVRAVMFHNGYAFGGNYGDSSWENDVDWGGPGAFYIEDCKIYKPSGMYGAIDGWHGGRVVFRYNEVINSRLGNHGTESGQRFRSARSMEIYNNTFTNTIEPAAYIDIRGGTAVVFGNVMKGPSSTNSAAVKLNDYRSRTLFFPWGIADGTKAWDGADLSDGPETPGGAGDGVFETGKSTATAANILTDSSKNWVPNQWRGYTVRVTVPMRSSSGGLLKTILDSVSWLTNQWSGFEITKFSTNEKSRVASNTSNSIVLASDSYNLSLNAGDDFELSKSAEIASNTADTLTVHSMFDGVKYTFPVNASFEIRKVDWSLDQPGRGKTKPIVGSPANHQNVNQEAEPIYQWNNTLNGNAVVVSNGYPTIKKNRDYYDNTPKPNYTPYTYPHPLRKPGAPSNVRIAVDQ